MRVVLFNGRQVTLRHAFAAKRSQVLELSLADMAAGGGKTLQERFAGQSLVEGDEFAQFIAARMQISILNGGQFEREQNPGVISPQKAS